MNHRGKNKSEISILSLVVYVLDGKSVFNCHILTLIKSNYTSGLMALS